MVCLIGLDQHYHMLQCRYHWGWLLMPTHYLTLPTLVSAFSVLFVCYPLEALKWRLTHHIKPMSALPRIAHTVLRKKFESSKVRGASGRDGKGRGDGFRSENFFIFSQKYTLNIFFAYDCKIFVRSAFLAIRVREKTRFAHDFSRNAREKSRFARVFQRTE